MQALALASQVTINRAVLALAPRSIGPAAATSLDATIARGSGRSLPWEHLLAIQAIAAVRQPGERESFSLALPHRELTRARGGTQGCGGWAKGHLQVASTRAYPQSLSTVTAQKKQVRPAVTLPPRSADAAAPILNLTSFQDAVVPPGNFPRKKKTSKEKGQSFLNSLCAKQPEPAKRSLKPAHGGRRDRRGETHRYGQ